MACVHLAQLVKPATPRTCFKQVAYYIMIVDLYGGGYGYGGDRGSRSRLCFDTGWKSCAWYRARRQDKIGLIRWCGTVLAVRCVWEKHYYYDSFFVVCKFCVRWRRFSSADNESALTSWLCGLLCNFLVKFMQLLTNMNQIYFFIVYIGKIKIGPC